MRRGEDHVEHLIRELEAFLSETRADKETVRGVADRLEQFLGGRPAIGARYERPGDGTYARRLMHKDPQGRFVIIVMTWGPGHGTPIHDHGTWGVVGMLRNGISA
jgi:predicted metal-dependent enzyme (double-stranded beta helix superfamily)